MLKLNERYPGRFNNPSVDYPEGSFKNRTAPSAKDGSYLEQDWANDREGFFQSLLASAGMEANGLVDKVGASQIFDALQRIKQNQSGQAYVSAGTATALTLTTVPAVDSYVMFQRFNVKFHINSGANPTINISGRGAKNLKQYDGSGSKVAAVFIANQISDVIYDGTDLVLLAPISSVAQATESNLGLVKIASQAQTSAGADDSTSVTPKKLKLGFASLFEVNGYIVFPTWLGGFTIQWGLTAALRESSTTITLPIAYTGAHLAAYATVNLGMPNANGNYGAYALPSGLSQVIITGDDSIASGSGGPQTIRWLSIGKML